MPGSRISLWKTVVFKDGHHGRSCPSHSCSTLTLHYQEMECTLPSERGGHLWLLALTEYCRVTLSGSQGKITICGSAAALWAEMLGTGVLTTIAAISLLWSHHAARKPKLSAESTPRGPGTAWEIQEGQAWPVLMFPSLPAYGCHYMKIPDLAPLSWALPGFLNHR